MSITVTVPQFGDAYEGEKHRRLAQELERLAQLSLSANQIESLVESAGDSFAGLSDTAITNPQQNDLAFYNDSTEKWENRQLGPTDITESMVTQYDDQISPLWDNVRLKPSTFPPSPHTHTPDEIIGLEAFIDALGYLKADGDYTITGDWEWDANLVLLNNRYIRAQQLDTTERSILGIDPNDVVNVGAAANDMLIKGADIQVRADTFNVGDPGLEAGGVVYNGLTLTAVQKLNRFGGGGDIGLTVHRHANGVTQGANVLATRARGTDENHVDVLDGDVVGRYTWGAWHTDGYYGAAEIEVTVDGTPGLADMPARMDLCVSADGSSTPEPVIQLVTGLADVTGDLAVGFTTAASVVLSGSNSTAQRTITFPNSNARLAGADVAETISPQWTFDLMPLVGIFPIVPAAGAAGQVLSKIDATNYNTQWADPNPGGGSVQGRWNFSTTITAADPGPGNFRYNNANPALVTEIYFDDLSNVGFDASTIFGSLLPGDVLFIQQVNDSTRYAVFVLSSAPTDNTGWWTFSVTVDSSGVLPQDTEPCGVVIFFSGSRVNVLNDLDDVNTAGAANNDLLFLQGGIWQDTAGLLGWSGTLFNVAGTAAINVEQNAMSTLYVGEPTVARGTAQEGELILYGEDGVSMIEDFRIVNQGSVVQIRNDVGGLAGITLEDMDLNLLGVDLIVGTAALLDTATFSHDGADFNTSFIGTTDWNIGLGLTGSVRTSVPIDAASRITITRNENNIFSVWSAADGSLNEMNCRLTASDDFTFRPLPGGVAVTDREFGYDFLDAIWFAESGMRISNPARTDWGDFEHDGTDFTTDFFQTADWNITGLTGQFSVTMSDSGLFLWNGDSFLINSVENAATAVLVGEATITRGAAQNSLIRLYAEDSSAINYATVSYTGTQLRLATNSDASIGININTDADVELFHSGLAQLRTLDNTDSGGGAGNTSGVEIRHTNGAVYMAGFNQEPFTILNGALTGVQAWLDRAGLVTFKTNAAASTFTIPPSTATEIPNGSYWTFLNQGTGNITIAQGAGTLLRWMNGLNTVGNRTLAQWGMVRVWRRSAALWYIVDLAGGSLT